MKQLICLIAAFPLLCHASEEVVAPDAPELKHALESFLDGASNSDAAAHERFWSDDLVYTSSNGRRFGKTEIMASLADPEGKPSDDAARRYSAEDVRVRQYGDTAVVAFRLLGVTPGATAGEEPRVAEFYNTGTFVRQGGAWKAVAWQATRIPEAPVQAGVD